MINHPLLVIVLSLLLLCILLFWRYRNKQKQVLNQLYAQLLNHDSAVPSSAEIPIDLPPPVHRYLSKVLPTDSHAISKVKLLQHGRIRTHTDKDHWLSFSAEHVVAPLVKGFIWNARVTLPKLPSATHIQVIDSYLNGCGSGSVNVFSAFTVADAANEAELNSGALHRYLAEAVWYPTALLPQFGVHWTAKDDHSAVATLTDLGTSVSLEFRFNEADEVVTVYTPERFRCTAGVYQQTAWEGHFKNYQRHQGFLLPTQGEVGWYDEDKLKLVWLGQVSNFALQTT